MRLTLLLLALALPLSAQTKLELLQAEYQRVNHEIQKEMALGKLLSVKLFVVEDPLLTAHGFSVLADTTDGRYVQVVMPNSLTRESRLLLREARIKFLKTSVDSVIRIPGNSLKDVAKVLKASLQ